jgi:hypothetical protein
MVEMDIDDGEVFGDAEDDLENAAQPGGATLISPEEFRAPERFEADLGKLRHWRAGDQEIDLLTVITNDEIAKAAEKRTGRKAEEILSTCTLLIGDVQFLDSWIVLWPNRFIRAEDQFPVRLLLQFAWWYSTLPNQDRETDRALASVSDAITRFRADTELDARQEKLDAQRQELAAKQADLEAQRLELVAQQEKLDAEQERRSAGGRAAAVSEKRSANREGLIQQWASVNNKPEHERATLIAKRLGITAGQVRRLVKKTGLR